MSEVTRYLDRIEKLETELTEEKGDNYVLWSALNQIYHSHNNLDDDTDKMIQSILIDRGHRTTIFEKNLLLKEELKSSKDMLSHVIDQGEQIGDWLWNLVKEKIDEIEELLKRHEINSKRAKGYQSDFISESKKRNEAEQENKRLRSLLDRLSKAKSWSRVDEIYADYLELLNEKSKPIFLEDKGDVPKEIFDKLKEQS